MAKATVNAALGWDMADPDFSRLYYGTQYVRTSKAFIISDGQTVVDFRGTGFEYTNGLPSGGTMHEAAVKSGSETALLITGFSIQAADFTHAANTLSPKDDLAVFAKMFSGDDVISGGGKGDTLLGFGGDDHIDGGAGADTMSGGAGADTFVYKKASESNFDSLDVLTDFSVNQHDRIDVSAFHPGGGHGHLHFVGTHNFAHAGDLGYGYKNGHTYVGADLNGDGSADLVISIKGNVSLHESDFIL